MLYIFVSLVGLIAILCICNKDKGCNFNCSDCPFPQCSEYDKEMQKQWTSQQ